MSWKDNLLDASFRGLVFECIGTSDTLARSLVEHGYPGVDGADVEDMGAQAAHVSIRAVFYGDDYEARLQSFVAALDGQDDALSAEDARNGGWLQHPVFGMMFVQVASRRIVHDAESVDEAQLEIEFVESTPAAPFFARELAAQKADAIAQHGELAGAAATNGISATIERLRAANPLAGLDALRDKLTAPILAITSGIGVVLSGLDPLAYPRAWGNDISAMVGGLLDAREWGEQLVADWAGIRSDLDAFSIFSAAPSPAPAPVTSSIAPSEAQAIAAAAATLTVNTAIGLANAAGLMLAGEADTPSLAPVEIEAIANLARDALAAAIEQVRAVYNIEQSRTITEPLKDQALAVQEAARAIIAARPPLIWRSAETSGNMRLMAHLWYGDHTRAPELYRLNGARSPFVNAGDSVHAYAS